LEWQLEAVARRFYYVESVYVSGSGPVKRQIFLLGQNRQDVALAIRVIRRIAEPSKVVVERHNTHCRSVVALVGIAVAVGQNELLSIDDARLGVYRSAIPGRRRLAISVRAIVSARSELNA
jgi:hypothetical protein